jgi:hypothetical protein
MDMAENGCAEWFGTPENYSKNENENPFTLPIIELFSFGHLGWRRS